MKKDIKKVLIITTNWNDNKRTLRCLSSLLKIKNTQYDILIIDNNSKKKNYKLLKRGVKKLKRKFILNEIKNIDYKKKLKKNSIIIFDDYNQEKFPELVDVVNEFVSKEKIRRKYILHTTFVVELDN